jgi:lysozyme
MSECESRLLSEVREYEAAVLRACTIAPSQCQFDALVSLAWNIGIAGMSSSSVVRYHNKKDFVNAAKSFSMWNKAGGKVVQGLVNRREAEATLYLS